MDELIENIQLAENEEIDECSPVNSEDKRALLKKTKIVRQTWSILEIYQKIKGSKLVLNPDYQRNEVWNEDKKTAFIESLFMGIIIPPIYVVEIPGLNFLEENKYEVVDGKQRLSTINAFIDNRLKLKGRALEYYSDCFSEKYFADIRLDNNEIINGMLSSVLDIYVITANSPEFTKYDIFSRLNKGSEPLRVNEIRKAVYQSEMMHFVNEYVDQYVSYHPVKGIVVAEPYCEVFKKRAIQRYEDYGRFFRSIAFFYQSDINTNKVNNYNSRPREMINDVLARFQLNEIPFKKSEVQAILDCTIQLLLCFGGEKYCNYLIDSCIPYCVRSFEKIKEIATFVSTDGVIQETLEKSPSTTSNVNERLRRIGELVNGK